jgi:hypothetical protein
MVQERYRCEHESLDESGRVTDFHRIVRVVRKLETRLDARMGSNARIERTKNDGSMVHIPSCTISSRVSSLRTSRSGATCPLGPTTSVLELINVENVTSNLVLFKLQGHGLAVLE